jgi:inner membrane protein
MMGKTHIAIGITVGTLLSYQYNLDLSSQLGMVGAAALGSLLPDLDSPVSTLGKLLPINPLRILHHRGPLHSALILIALMGIYLSTGQLWQLGLFVGYASHLFADALTLKGIPLFYPIKINFRLCPIPIFTGGIVDYLLFGISWIFLAFVIFNGGDIHRMISYIPL